MRYFIKLYLLTLLPFTLLDALWLRLVAPAFYRSRIGFTMAASLNWGAAVLFYLLFIAGMLGTKTG